MKKLLLLPAITLFLISCNQPTKEIVISTDDLHASVDKVTKIMIHDIFSPPVASRIFAYPNIAAYEIIAQKDSSYTSLAGQLTDLTKIPKPDQEINYDVSAMVAHMDISKRLIFSEVKMEELIDSLYTVWESNDPVLFMNSKTYGLQVADHIAAWMSKDNYKQTRTMPKFAVETDDPQRWQPTPSATSIFVK